MRRHSHVRKRTKRRRRPEEHDALYTLQRNPDTHQIAIQHLSFGVEPHLHHHKWRPMCDSNFYNLSLRKDVRFQHPKGISAGQRPHSALGWLLDFSTPKVYRRASGLTQPWDGCSTSAPQRYIGRPAVTARKIRHANSQHYKRLHTKRIHDYERTEHETVTHDTDTRYR